MAISIRFAAPDDASLIVSFIRELAAFEKAGPDEVRVTPDDILRHGFGEHPRFECLIANVDDRPVGFALFFHNFSTWEGSDGIYLEDIFVRDSVRGRGVGRALMAALGGIARERGCRRLDLSVLDWNPARRFYDRLGARQMTQWLPYRFGSAELAALAAPSE